METDTHKYSYGEIFMINFKIENLDKSENTKFYRISEAATLLGISIPTLRMYEREGLILPFRRGSKHRRFAESDIQRIRNIRAMINTEKVSIAGIKRLYSLIPCWKLKSCSEELKQHCNAFNQQSEPCWMVMPKSLNCSNSDCRLCPVYNDLSDCKSLKQIIARFTNSQEHHSSRSVSRSQESIIHMPEVEIIPEA
jgi:MerR family transcriptional regulator, heat shock protein HspR